MRGLNEFIISYLNIKVREIIYNDLINEDHDLISNHKSRERVKIMIEKAEKWEKR